MWQYTYDPSTQKVESRRSEVQGHPPLHGELQGLSSYGEKKKKLLFQEVTGLPLASGFQKPALTQGLRGIWLNFSIAASIWLSVLFVHSTLH